MAKNSSIFNESLSLFMERFPHLGLFVPTWPYKEAVEEEIAPLSLQKEELFYFYGLGRGSFYPQFKKWLRENGERELIILEDDPGIIAAFLHRREAEEILSDPQVHIELISKAPKQLDQELQVLADRYPVKRMELAALPSYRGSRYQTIRLKLLRKTTLSHALYVDRLHGYQPFHNFIENLKILPNSFYANGLRNSFQGIPALVCGAGPSLQKSIEQIRSLENRALIIAGGSTLAALSSVGILPHFGMAIDPNLEEYRRLKNSFAFEVPLLYSTRVFPAIFQTCNGPFGYMRSGIGGVPELWMEEELGLTDPLLGGFLSPESISVTAICVAWAQFLGCNPIILDGVDLAYTGNKRYAAGVAEDEEVPFKKIDAEKSAADRIIKRKDREGNPIHTAVRWVMESASISYFAKKHPEIRFINSTDGGLGFQGIDFIPLSEIPFEKTYDLRTLVHEKIIASPMPAGTKEIIQEKMGNLRESLDRIIDHLQVLTGEKKGSPVLAEMELKEEMAYDYLFFDIDQVLSLRGCSWMPQETFEEKAARTAQAALNKWKQFLTLARKYRLMLS